MSREELALFITIAFFVSILFFSAPHSTRMSSNRNDGKSSGATSPTGAAPRMAIPSFTPTPSLNAGEPSLPPELKGGLTPRARKLVMIALTLLGGFLGFEARSAVKPDCECPQPCPSSSSKPRSPEADFILVDPNR